MAVPLQRDVPSLKATIATLISEALPMNCPSTSPDFGVSLLHDSLFADETKHVKSPYAGYGVKSAQGLSKHMEDSYSVQEKLSSPGPPLDSVPKSNHDASTGGAGEINIPGFDEDLAFFSVFDGHGGDEVAQHCSDRLHEHFTKQLLHAATSNNTDVEGSEQPSMPCFYPSIIMEALRTSFHTTDQELAGTEAGEFVGATAVVAVVGSKHIWVAHCGDSRAVIQRSGDATALTSDHKPDREDEAARIKAAGGRIVYLSGTNRVQGMLAMSRSIGDHYLRPYVIADPEVMCIDRMPEDEVLIIATDGLWDVFSCTEATNLANRCINRSRERGMSKHGACRVAASVLAKAAMERGSRDNITVIIVDISLSMDVTDSLGKEVPSSASSVQPTVDPSEPPASQSGSMGKYLLLKSQKLERSTQQDVPCDPPRHTYSHDDLRTLNIVLEGEETGATDACQPTDSPSSGLTVCCTPTSGRSPSRFKRSPCRINSSPLLLSRGGIKAPSSESVAEGDEDCCEGSRLGSLIRVEDVVQEEEEEENDMKDMMMATSAVAQDDDAVAPSGSCESAPSGSCDSAIMCRVSLDSGRDEKQSKAEAGEAGGAFAPDGGVGVGGEGDPEEQPNECMRALEFVGRGVRIIPSNLYPGTACSKILSHVCNLPPEKELDAAVKLPAMLSVEGLGGGMHESQLAFHEALTHLSCSVPEWTREGTGS